MRCFCLEVRFRFYLKQQAVFMVCGFHSGAHDLGSPSQWAHGQALAVRAQGGSWRAAL